MSVGLGECQGMCFQGHIYDSDCRYMMKEGAGGDGKHSTSEGLPSMFASRTNGPAARPHFALLLTVGQERRL